MASWINEMTESMRQKARVRIERGPISRRIARFSFCIRCPRLYRRGEAPARDCSRKNWYSTRDIGQLDADGAKDGEGDYGQCVYRDDRRIKTGKNDTCRTSVKEERCPSCERPFALRLMRRWPTGLNCSTDAFMTLTNVYLLNWDQCVLAHACFGKIVVTVEKKNPNPLAK